MLLHLYVTLHTLGVNLHSRADKVITAARDERGSVTLEQVVITAALALLAIGAVAAIGVAVQTQLSRL
jgi:Flp pilus assembly pilin Flp